MSTLLRICLSLDRYSAKGNPYIFLIWVQLLRPRTKVTMESRATSYSSRISRDLEMTLGLKVDSQKTENYLYWDFNGYTATPRWRATALSPRTEKPHIQPVV